MVRRRRAAGSTGVAAPCGNASRRGNAGADERASPMRVFKCRMPSR